LLRDTGKALLNGLGRSAYAGNEVLVNRDQGFSKRLKEIAPDLQILPVRYIDNDIQKAMSSASDLLLANSDLLGFFGDNNHSGDGVALALRDR
jgi:ribose transport system substrate-binding protein